MNFISCEEEDGNGNETNDVVIKPVETRYTGTINVNFKGQATDTEGVDSLGFCVFIDEFGRL